MPRFIVGRSNTSDIIINDPSVSRSHAELIIEGSFVTIRDLGSANGTFVNGMRINGTHPISGFDIVKLGNSLLPWKNYTSGLNQPPQTVFNQARSFEQSNQNVPMIPVPLPNASATLVLGICSILFSCALIGLVLGIIGLSLGSKGRKLYAASPNRYTNYNSLNAGYICSIIGTVLGGLYVIYFIWALFVIGAAAVSVADILNTI